MVYSCLKNVINQVQRKDYIQILMNAGSDDSSINHEEDNKEINVATTRFEKTLNKEVQTFKFFFKVVL